MQLIHCMEAAFYFSPKEIKCKGELRKEQSIPAESHQNFNIHLLTDPQSFNIESGGVPSGHFVGSYFFMKKDNPLPILMLDVI